MDQEERMIEDWRFPVDSLKIEKGVLVLVKHEGEEMCIGIRLHLQLIELPVEGFETGVVDHYAETELELNLDIEFDWNGLGALENRVFNLEEPVEGFKEELGYFDLFDFRHPLGFQEIAFKEIDGDAIKVEFDLYFDFREVGVLKENFRKRLEGMVTVEKRWMH